MPFKTGKRATAPCCCITTAALVATRRNQRRQPRSFSGIFSFGRADVVRDPLADELRFDIRYYQVYAHNIDGLIAGTLHWSRYQGDRPRWAGWAPAPPATLRSSSTAFTGSYSFEGEFAITPQPYGSLPAGHDRPLTASAIGTGGTFVGPSNNCSQDSNQALFASIQYTAQNIRDKAPQLQDWAVQHPEEGKRLKQLIALDKDLKNALQPFGKPRPDWEKKRI